MEPRRGRGLRLWSGIPGRRGKRCGCAAEPGRPPPIQWLAWSKSPAGCDLHGRPRVGP
jgi:hypothetical protein